MLLLVPRITPRVEYTVRALLPLAGSIRLRVTDSPEEFQADEGAKLSYGGKRPEGDAPHLMAYPLLFEDGVQGQDTDFFRLEDGTPCLYPVNPEASALPFDPFAAAFFLLSRYEEYLSFSPDTHGRFPATASVAHQRGFLHEPMVERWAALLQVRLRACFAGLRFADSAFRHISTFDIDNAWAYRHKGAMRAAGGLAKALLTGRVAEVAERAAVLSMLRPDPYDTYSYIHRIHRERGAEARFFFLLADRSEHDRNVPHTSTRLQKLIRTIAKGNGVGIHPGYASNHDPSLLTMEKQRLEAIIAQPVTHSRQHFLKLSLPDTYRHLIASGITDDWTMGYADRPGFRAGTAKPFKWYDLMAEQETTLTVHPLAVMDGTLHTYMRMSPEAALAELHSLRKSAQAVGGEFVTLWHNDTVRDSGEWQGWRRVFEGMWW